MGHAGVHMTRNDFFRNQKFHTFYILHFKVYGNRGYDLSMEFKNVTVKHNTDIAL